MLNNYDTNVLEQYVNTISELRKLTDPTKSTWPEEALSIIDACADIIEALCYQADKQNKLLTAVYSGNLDSKEVAPE